MGIVEGAHAIDGEQLLRECADRVPLLDVQLLLQVLHLQLQRVLLLCLHWRQLLLLHLLFLPLRLPRCWMMLRLKCCRIKSEVCGWLPAVLQGGLALLTSSLHLEHFICDHVHADIGRHVPDG